MCENVSLIRLWVKAYYEYVKLLTTVTQEWIPTTTTQYKRCTKCHIEIHFSPQMFRARGMRYIFNINLLILVIFNVNSIKNPNQTWKKIKSLHQLSITMQMQPYVVTIHLNGHITEFCWEIRKLTLLKYFNILSYY